MAGERVTIGGQDMALADLTQAMRDLIAASKPAGSPAPFSPPAPVQPYGQFSQPAPLQPYGPYRPPGDPAEKFERGATADQMLIVMRDLLAAVRQPGRDIAEQFERGATTDEMRIVMRPPSDATQQQYGPHRPPGDIAEQFERGATADEMRIAMRPPSDANQQQYGPHRPPGDIAEQFERGATADEMRIAMRPPGVANDATTPGGGREGGGFGGYGNHPGAMGQMFRAMAEGVIPISLVITAAHKINQQFELLSGTLGNVNERVISFGVGMAQTLGVPKSIAELGGAVANLFSPLKLAETGVKALQFAILPVLNLDKPGEIVKDVFKSIGEVGSKLATVFLDLRDPAAMLTQAISPFVSQVNKFNPGAVDRMNLAFDNLSAAAGRIFEPVINAAEGFANELNVIYTAIGPEMRGLVASIAGPVRVLASEFVGGFFGMIRDSIPVFRGMIEDVRPLGPIVSEFGKNLILLTGYLISTGAGLVKAFMWITDVVQGVGSAFGINFMDVIIGGATVLKWTLITIAIGLAIAFAPLIVAALALAAPFVALGLAITKVLSMLGHATRAEPTPTPSAPTGLGMTYAAREARHISIEDVGMEARRASYSQGSSIQEQMALSAAQTAANTQTQIALLRQLVSQGALSVNALPPGVML